MTEVGDGGGGGGGCGEGGGGGGGTGLQGLSHPEHIVHAIWYLDKVFTAVGVASARCCTDMIRRSNIGESAVLLSILGRETLKIGYGN